jgi:hypothetical protein
MKTVVMRRVHLIAVLVLTILIPVQRASAQLARMPGASPAEPAKDKLSARCRAGQ